MIENKEFKIGILDDLFPNVKTGFRIAEFNWYLNHLPHTQIFSQCYLFEQCLDEYAGYFSENVSRIKNKQTLTNEQLTKELQQFDMLYMVFLENAMRYIQIADNVNKPFVFTLYPGGGFLLNSPIVDQRLQIALNSPYLKKVIVTQQVTYDYLITKHSVSKDKIEFIYGGVTNPPFRAEKKKYYQKDKNTFDICFAAFKYMPRGVDKGYDIFIEVCKYLHKIDNRIRFHVMGEFDENDIDVSELGDHIIFYGIKNADFFPEFYSQMDIMISPTRSLNDGIYHGFPTTCCIDAAFNGCLIFTTDPLKSNLCYKDGEDIVIVNEEAETIASKILYYKENIEALYNISLKGQQKFKQIFDIDTQMNKRLDVLKSAIL